MPRQQGAAILQGLDADSKKAGDQAAVARAWLDLARFLREQEKNPDAFAG
jgi:hypothetical protein